MKRTLTLEIPADFYEPLAQMAEQKGQTPEELAAEWLIAAGKAALEDPLEKYEKYIVAFTANVPGWTEHIDMYLGQVLYDEMRDNDKECNASAK